MTGSDDWWDRYDRTLASKLSELGLSRTDVVDTADTFALLGWHGVEQGLQYRAKVGGMEPPPAPIFRVMRSIYWLKTDIEAWAAPCLAKRAEQSRKAEQKRAARACRAERAAMRYQDAPVGVSGYRGVGWFEPGGYWRAALSYQENGKSKTISGGYYREVEDAARAVDYLRWQHGYPPINLPESFDETLARSDEWESRVTLGPRGLKWAVVAALQGVVLDVDGVLKAVESFDTTRRTVAVTLSGLRKSGHIIRVSRGHYTAAPT